MKLIPCDLIVGGLYRITVVGLNDPEKHITVLKKDDTLTKKLGYFVLRRNGSISLEGSPIVMYLGFMEIAWGGWSNHEDRTMQDLFHSFLLRDKSYYTASRPFLKFKPVVVKNDIKK